MAQILLQTVWFIPCYPLIGGILSLLWLPAITRRTGPRPAGYVNAILTFLAFAHGAIALTAIWNQPAQQQFIPWLKVAGLD
ncbi:MAG: NAD(P)H-quinone oxidoreductase subunit F, partial [Oscillatoriales cyanobacterium RU_3_3]|nr:NAD(P)H-quinone oxidoreductase subunit F [Oscillatoriales cyanobacterium RU_3_3]